MAPLPGAIVLTLALWLWRGPMDWEGGLALALMLLTTLMLRQMSNALQLIRVRSWAVSTVFVVLMAVGTPIHQWNPWANAMGVLFMVYVIGLLTSYQSRKPQVSIFWGTAALSVCSLMVPKLLWLTPIIIVSMMMPLRCCTSRALVALLLGLLLPYELWGAWNLYNGTIVGAATAHWQSLTSISFDFLLPEGGTDAAAGSIGAIKSAGMGENGALGITFTNWKSLILQEICSARGAVVTMFVVYCVISIFHFFYTSLDDKTRTRMLFFSLMMHWPVMLAIFLLGGGLEDSVFSLQMIAAGHQAADCAQQAADVAQCAMLWPPLCIVSAPLLAHYFVFSRKWTGALMFYLFLLLCLFLALRPL